jgi:hypothetical protein
MLDMITHFFAAFPSWVHAGLTLVAGASALVALTPCPRDDTALAWARKLLELLALNVGHAKDRYPKRDGENLDRS